jgi:DNA-binding NtrC family response regulator
MELKVLVVDDEKVLAGALAERLSFRKANAIVAHTGKEAIDRVSKFKPDVVLLDCRLPDLDGFEVLKQIKGDYPEVKVIMYTGYADKFKRREAERLGAFDYFEKPADFEDIWVSMLRAVRQKVEDYETAITFAQAGLHEEAREIIKGYNKK